MHVLFTFCLLTIVFNGALSMEEDYYWKEYNGEIPSDAFPAGKDKNGNDTYIGQAYIHDYGLAVSQIFPGEKELTFPMYGARNASRLIKIFCTEKPNKLSWIPTTAQTFHVDTFGLHPVLGGSNEHENSNEDYNIGRVMYKNCLKIGAITSTNVESATLYFTDGNVQQSASKYHTLVYNNSVVDIDNAIPEAIPYYFDAKQS